MLPHTPLFPVQTRDISRCWKPDQICKQFTRRGKQPPPHNSLLSNSPPPLVHQTTGLYGKNTRRTSKTVRTVDRVSLHSFSSDVKKQISRPAAQPDHQPIPHFFKSITRIEWLEHHTDFETELNKTDWQFQHVATYVTTILTRHGTYGESYS